MRTTDHTSQPEAQSTTTSTAAAQLLSLQRRRERSTLSAEHHPLNRARLRAEAEKARERNAEEKSLRKPGGPAR